ncbi:mucoidy inhibitor MuiA family protein [Comamonas faecalis]|uniref:Mucoidy inhibitor MuiA family protein n=1 Tax=Comamonas faecalis TaxID=1387849 RepID=A0ABP7RFS4_9BURK
MKFALRLSPAYTRAPWLAGALLASAAGACAAQGARISAVTLYPGSATVERVQSLAAGSTQAVFDCLPAGLDARSLQVAADTAATVVGDIRVRESERALASGCASAQQARLDALDEQLAAVGAEIDALQLAQTYLHTVANGGIAPAPAPAGAAPKTGATAAPIAATSTTLQRTALDQLVQLHRAQQRQQALQLQRKALEQPGAPGGDRVSTVTVTLAAPQATQLRLSYQVRGPSWSPSYRALLDSDSGRLQLQRLALVAQNTGEDWQDVQLTLSTGQPLRATQGPLPRPWTLDERPEPPPEAVAKRAMVAAAPAPMAMAMRETAADDAPPGVQQDMGALATTFRISQRVSVPVGGERLTLTLASEPLQAQLLVRTTPMLDASAYLVAQLPQLEGVWPAGPVALYRDGAYAGQGRLDPGNAALWRQGLSFGRDERVQVSTAPERSFSAATGLTDSGVERTIERSWRVDNHHARAVQLQVLDAAPVSRNAKIRVQSQYEPAPADTAWNERAGTIAWTQELAAGASAQFSARHQLRYARDLMLQEQR